MSQASPFLAQTDRRPSPFLAQTDRRPDARLRFSAFRAVGYLRPNIIGPHLARQKLSEYVRLSLHLITLPSPSRVGLCACACAGMWCRVSSGGSMRGRSSFFQSLHRQYSLPPTVPHGTQGAVVATRSRLIPQATATCALELKEVLVDTQSTKHSHLSRCFVRFLLHYRIYHCRPSCPLCVYVIGPIHLGTANDRNDDVISDGTPPRASTS